MLIVPLVQRVSLSKKIKLVGIGLSPEENPERAHLMGVTLFPYESPNLFRKKKAWSGGVYQ